MIQSFPFFCVADLRIRLQNFANQDQNRVPTKKKKKLNRSRIKIRNINPPDSYGSDLVQSFKVGFGFATLFLNQKKGSEVS